MREMLILDQAVRALLAAPEIKVVFEEQARQYRLEYGTQIVAAEAAPETPKVRVYKLIDELRGSEMPNPWGDFDLSKQTVYVANAIRFSRYRLARVTEGWRATCPSCGFVSAGDEWRTRPLVCGNPLVKGKGHAIGSADVHDRALTPTRAAALGLTSSLAELKFQAGEDVSTGNG